MKQPVSILLAQSLANADDAEKLRRLILKVPGVTDFRQTARLTGGYSGSRVYLGTAELSGASARLPWILKVGTAEDLKAEYEGYIRAKSAIDADHIVAAIHFAQDGDDALIVYDYVGGDGRPPRDLEWMLRSVEAEPALAATLQIVESWRAHPTWSSKNLGEQLREWVQPKLGNLPQFVRDTADYKVLLCQDFGQPLANPIWFLKRTALHRRVANVPYSFVHGDLNLRNILFPTTSLAETDLSKGRLIDFRHATSDQFSGTDLAKLEACLRYGQHVEVRDQTALTQAVAFLSNTRNNIEIHASPEILNGNKDLQERWRMLGMIRRCVASLFNAHSDSVESYWATLLAYALSFCTYPNVTEQAQRFAYLDAAAIFTRLFGDVDLKARQLIFPFDRTLSPTVESQPEVGRSAAHASLLSRGIAEGRCVLVVGSYLGRAQGVAPLIQDLQMAHRDLGYEPPAGLSLARLLESLSRRFSRAQVIRTLKGRSQKVLRPEGIDILSNRPWAAVVHCQFHSYVWQVLANPARGRARIESDSELTESEGQKETTLYLPLLGDLDSREERAIGSAKEYRDRLSLLGRMGQMMERRRRPLCVLFWKCEDLAVDFMAELRDALSTHLTSPLDVYVLSDEEDTAREIALDALGVTRIRGHINDLPDPGLAALTVTVEGPRWRRGNTVVNLPDAARLTAGLLGYFQEMGGLRTIVPGEDDSFLLGAPASREDILEGRVVLRETVERDLLPAIHGAINSRSELVRVVLAHGRAGAGLSTCLCSAAHKLVRDEVCPVLVVARTEGYRVSDWHSAGEIASEVAQSCNRPAVVFWEINEGSDVRVDAFAEGASGRKGDIVLVLGGRTDVMRGLDSHLDVRRDWRVQVPDRLSDAEALALAGILQENGFAQGSGPEALASRIQNVGILLPAIYEATDRRNRKFHEIVTFEYRRYDRDHLTQRAYRLICLLSAYGYRLPQFWLLKSIGSASVHEAPIVLGRLAADVIREAGDGSDPSEDVLFSARHRIIAEAVLSIAYAEPSHRVVDIRSLIRNANMANPEEGGTVASMLVRRSPLMQWLRQAFEGHDEALFREARGLFEEALGNRPIAPNAEVTIRQHFALLLRWFHAHDEAIDQATAAYALDHGNVASIHVLALVHEARALAAWKVVGASPKDEKALAAAYADERDAFTFFRESRGIQPRQEYGYESEARYLRKRFDILTRLNVGVSSSSLRDLVKEGRRGLFVALDLLRQAERRVPIENQFEMGETKSIVVARMGDIEEAIRMLEGEIAATKSDPVRKIKLLSLAATLSAEAFRWSECGAYCKSAIDCGHHTAWIYALLDRALQKTGSRDERKRYLRESAQTWNKEDTLTLLTWAGFCLEEGEWERCQETLRAASELSRKEGLSHFEREKIRGWLRKVSPSGQGDVMTFSGEVERMIRYFEGMVRIDGVPLGVTAHFRVDDETASKLSVGSRVSFNVAWRITGLSAMDLRVAEVDADAVPPSTPPKGGPSGS